MVELEDVWISGNDGVVTEAEFREAKFGFGSPDVHTMLKCRYMVSRAASTTRRLRHMARKPTPGKAP